MADDAAQTSLIRTKLHKPPIHEKNVHRQRLFDLLDQPFRRPLTLVVAPAGYGKSILASCWVEAFEMPSAWVSLDENDNDLRLFINYLLAAVHTISPGAGRETQAMANTLTLPPVSALAGSLINELDRVGQPFFLVLDDFHLIKDDSVLYLLTQLLHHPPQFLHLVLVGRRDPALPITSLRAKRLLAEIRTQDLLFNETEIIEFLTQMLGTEIDSSTAAALAEKTEGWVTGLILAIFSMRNQGILDPVLLEPQVDAQSVMEYLFIETLLPQPKEIKQYLLNSAILDRFCGPLCEALRVPDPETGAVEFGGWEFIAWLKKENLFLIPLDAENRWFRFHHLFRTLLVNQLKRFCGLEDINALHDQASDWFAQNGLIEEAIKHALYAGNTAAASGLIAQHGFNLVSDEQWLTLEHWLKLLPEDILSQDLELVILLAWTHLVHSREADLISCLDRAETLLSARLPLQAAEKHLLGHFEVMRGRQNFYSADVEKTRIFAERANENIPREHGFPRILLSTLRALGYQMTGQIEKAQSVIEALLKDEALQGRFNEGSLLGGVGAFYWVTADLTTMLQATSRMQKRDPELQDPKAFGYSLYLSSIAHYHRNELHSAQEKLLRLVKSPYLLHFHSWNFAHSVFALALIYQIQGRVDKANELAELVTSFALDTNNTDVLTDARAFCAELALRQGRLANAAKWAEQFVAKPFTTMYRFYVRQFTLVRVLIAQDSAECREKAANLLKELYDFVIYTHNKRFQIDVLALQALLCDLRGERRAALGHLLHAVKLAEPDGFIRPFVDEGPRMADLLKRSQKQNVAVDYIEKILTAFRDDERTVLPEATGHHPSTRPPTSQPLVDPLTTRELDVLDLLAQRLSNQEIAEKLFISITTVKGHLQNIYQKLAVNKRREAVEKAETLGILKQR